MASSLSLKWCKKNLEYYSQAVHDLIREEFPDIDMEISDCVDMCGLCTDVPFALRNNAVIGARDAKGLYVKLKQGMEFLQLKPLPGTYAALVVASQETKNVAGEAVHMESKNSGENND